MTRQPPRDDPPEQQRLFGPPEPPAPPPVAACAHGAELRALAARLPRGVRLGTSSWNFAGWRGLVYATDAPGKLLSRHGLAAYAQHPLLTAVGIDRTYYAPIATADFAAYAAAVPAHFRFLVKAWNELTMPFVRGRPGRNPNYLDAMRAIDLVIAPAVEGLGDRLGPLVFQFPPQGPAVTKHPERFADRLHVFCAELPPGGGCAIELRDEALLTQRYAEALAATGVRHCFCLHPRMPTLRRQREVVGPAGTGGPVAVRWMLHAGLDYDEAKAGYEPFDRLVDPDPARRGEIVELCREALAGGGEVIVVINNKAEGSAPLSVLELARALPAAG